MPADSTPTEDQAAWTCSANDALQVSIVQPGGDGKLKTLSTFYPQFTYPIFGDSETIFGYKGLMMQLRFAAHDLRSNVCISYDEKFKAVEDVAPADLNKALKAFLPEASFTPLPKFEESVINDNDAKDFTPPGKLCRSYTKRKRNYEIWKGSLLDPKVQELLDRIQIFVSLYIEGGTPIETDDFEWTLDRWTVSFLYEKLDEPPTPDASVYSFVGYVTTYRWYFFDRTGKRDEVVNTSFPYGETLDSASLPSRLRISQFLILQPHQLSGHGTELYRTVHDACLQDSTIRELTIEDPNEAFDALRDTNDYTLLQPIFEQHIVSINVDPPSSKQERLRHPRFVPTSLLLPTETIRNIRRDYKIAPTQFAHLLEMYLLSLIPMSHRGSHNVNLARLRIQKSRAANEHDRRYYWWRMLVKQRLYKRHRDMLIQLDRAERVEKLEETLHNVEEGYENLLKAFVLKTQAGSPLTLQNQETGAEAGETEGKGKGRTKRKYAVLDEDDESDDNGPPPKPQAMQARVEQSVVDSPKKAKIQR
ncbi:histone acetyltransferase 1 [Ophidiomyces ophidiicola]|nr:histone acetyltransferase 1 [Ophidiomyces ophidiicola]